MADKNIDNVAAAAPEVVTAENPAAQPSEKPQIAAVEDITHAHCGHKLDAAAELLRKTGDAENGRIVFTAADNKRVLRKIDLVILPILLTVYFLQALDKATLSYASVFNLITDTNLVGTQYSWLGSIVYLAQLIMQPILAWLLIRLPIGKFSSTMVLCWGITLACMAAANNFGGLLAARFMLGAFEASIAPAFLAVTQMWWRRREQTVRVASWYAMNGITNMVRDTEGLSSPGEKTFHMLLRNQLTGKTLVRKSDHLGPRSYCSQRVEVLSGMPCPSFSFSPPFLSPGGISFSFSFP